MYQGLTWKEFTETPDFDAAVRSACAIDRFCSCSDWILPASEALMPPRTPWLFRLEHGYVAMMSGCHPDGWRYAEALEAAWGMACPLIGADDQGLATDFAELCRARESEWDVLLLTGLPEESALFAAVVGRLAKRYRLLRRSTTTRHVADLRGGLDAYLGRRSRNFRKGLRRARRAARLAGIEFGPCHPAREADAAAVFSRLLDVEARSWKGRSGVGIDRGPMEEFYRLMLRRLARRRAARVWFASHGGRDVAYILGGVLDASYRGLQLSFDDAYRSYSLGALCQIRQIEELCDQAYASYDLGMSMAYKRRWAENTIDSAVLLVFKG